MNREIKFRGKLIDDSEWVYGNLVQWKDGDCSIYVECENAVFQDEYTVHPDTVGQYTGAKDMNGKEIWEGDILMMSKSKEDLGIVKWFEDRPVFIIRRLHSLEWFYLCDGHKVIGNRWDNPELLEDGK